MGLYSLNEEDVYARPQELVDALGATRHARFGRKVGPRWVAQQCCHLFANSDTWVAQRRGVWS